MRRHAATCCATALHKMGFGIGRARVRQRDLRAEGRATRARTSARALAARPRARPGARPGLRRRLARRAPPRRLGHRHRRRLAGGTQGSQDRSTTSCRPISTQGLPPRSAGRSTSCWRPTCSSTSAIPSSLLDQVARLLAPDGVLVASVPNFGHWYPRLRVLLGTVRLRPARHPRSNPSSVLHTPIVPIARRTVRLAGRADRRDRLTPRHRRTSGQRRYE